MNDKPGLSDEAIRALLEKRAGRPDVAGRLAAARTAAAATPQRRAGRFAWATGRTPTLVGATGLAAVVLLLVAVGLASRTPSAATPTGSAAAVATAAPGPSGPNLIPLPSGVSGSTVLNVDQLNSLIATNPGAVNGRLLIIQGVINGTGAICTTGPGAKCSGPKAYLDRSTPELDVEPLMALGPGPWSPGTAPPLAGVFAATLVGDSELDYLGPVATGQGLTDYLPSQLPNPSKVWPSSAGSYWLVQGWIAGLEADLPCPGLVGSPSAGLDYDCHRNTSLSDTSVQPVSELSFAVPPDGIEVQNDAYDTFAPNPQAVGTAAVPEQAEFLVHVVGVPAPTTCPASDYCPNDAVVYHWAIATRLDLPFVPVIPQGQSSSPPTPPQPVLPMTVEQLTALLDIGPPTLRGRQLVITGELADATPVSSCVGPIAGCGDRVILLGSEPPVAVVAGPSTKLPSALPFRGTFAATLVDGSTLQFERVVTTAADGGPIVPSKLPALGPTTQPGSYWLVQGWLAGFDVAVPCAFVPTPPPGPQYYGCGVTSSLSDTAAQPVSGTSFNVPKDGVQVQDRAYDDFAPSPQLTGHGTEPEQATFLVGVNPGPCPPGISCTAFGGLHWYIVTRIDPWPDAAQP